MPGSRLSRSRIRRSDLDHARHDHRPATILVVDPATDRAPHNLLELMRIGDPVGGGAIEGLGQTSGITASKTDGSSQKPFAETVGPPTTLPVTESTTTVRR